MAPGELSAQSAAASHVRWGTAERTHEKGSKAQLMFGSCDRFIFSHAVNAPHALSVSEALWGGSPHVERLPGSGQVSHGSFTQTAPSLSGACGPITREGPRPFSCLSHIGVYLPGHSSLQRWRSSLSTMSPDSEDLGICGSALQCRTTCSQFPPWAPSM